MGQGLTGTRKVDTQPVLPQYATSALPSSGVTGSLVYDTTTQQLKVKTTDGTATYRAIGDQKLQGSYTGTGAAGRLITLDWAPDLVIVTSTTGRFGFLHRTESTTYQSQVIAGYLSAYTGGGGNEILTTTGFKVGGNGGAYLNESGATYQYTAFKFV